MSRLCKNHVTHIWMNEITRINKSCHTCERVTSHIYEWIESHEYTSRVTHVKRCLSVYEWMKSHIWMNEITRRIHKSCHTCERSSLLSLRHMCDVTLVYSLFYRALLQKRPIILSILQTESIVAYDGVTEVMQRRSTMCVHTRRKQKDFFSFYISSLHCIAGAMQWRVTRCAHKWVMSHTWKGHVAHTNESCHTYEWAIGALQRLRCNVDSIYKRKRKYHTICTQMSHVTHVNESCHACEWVMSHIWMSHRGDAKMAHDVHTDMSLPCHSLARKTPGVWHDIHKKKKT